MLNGRDPQQLADDFGDSHKLNNSHDKLLERILAENNTAYLLTIIMYAIYIEVVEQSIRDPRNNRSHLI